MSIYCVGDLHGRHDLFEALLEKVNFDVKRDHLYLLGDVINVSAGSMKILQRVMDNPDAFTLIRGNHEAAFLNYDILDVCFSSDQFALAYKQYVENLNQDVYEKMHREVLKGIRYRELESKSQTQKFRRWSIKSKNRRLLLEAIERIAELTDFDDDLYNQIYKATAQMKKLFKMKPFISELAEQGRSMYNRIKEMFLNLPEKIEFNYSDRQFILIHTPLYHPYATRQLVHWPDFKLKNTHIMFGHSPVASIHRNMNKSSEEYDYLDRSLISSEARYFDFNFREVLSYMDRFNNRYYNLDLSTNAAAFVRLDDMEEFYVMKYKKKAKSNLRLPEDSVKVRKVDHKRIDYCFEYYSEPNCKGKRVTKCFKDDNQAILTYNDYCMEFIIGIDYTTRKVYYKRVSYLKYYITNIIDKWFDNHNIQVVIDKVRFEDNLVYSEDSEQHTVEKRLRGLDREI